MVKFGIVIPDKTMDKIDKLFNLLCLAVMAYESAWIIMTPKMMKVYYIAVLFDIVYSMLLFLLCLRYMPKGIPYLLAKDFSGLMLAQYTKTKTLPVEAVQTITIFCSITCIAVVGTAFILFSADKLNYKNSILKRERDLKTEE